MNVHVFTYLLSQVVQISVKAIFLFRVYKSMHLIHSNTITILYEEWTMHILLYMYGSS